jgi:glutaredoxin
MGLCLAVAVLATPAQAEKLYKWVDKDGNVSYQDRPPPDSATQVQEREMSGQPGGGEGSAEAAVKFPVVLYAVPQCAGCDLARAYLKKRGIPFSEKNVANNRALQDEMKKKVGDLSVPTITVGSKVMKGYLESLLEGELDQAGYPKAARHEAGGENAGEENPPPDENAAPQ